MPEHEAARRELEQAHERAEDHSIGGQAERLARDGGRRCRRNATNGKHAAVECQRRFDLIGRGVRQVGLGVGQLEIDLLQADGTMRAQVANDHRRRLVEQNPRPRRPGVSHQIDKEIELVVGDHPRRAAIVETVERHKAFAAAAELTGHAILELARGERVRMNGHPRRIVPRNDVEHQPAHDVVTEIGGEITDVQHAGLADRRGGEIRDACALLLANPVVRGIELLQRDTRHVEVLRLRDRDAREGAITAPVRPVESERQILVLVLCARCDARGEESGGNGARGELRAGLERAEVLEGLVVTIEQQQMPAQSEPDLLAVGRKGARAFEQRERLGPAAQSIEDLRVIEQCLDRVRCELDGARESAFGVDEPV